MLKICAPTCVLLLFVGSIVSADDVEPVSVSIQLQWVTQAQFAGFYVAQELGFYEEEGLDVTILESNGDVLPIEAVAGGDAKFGVTWVPKVLKANEQGADLVNIAQVFQRSGTVLVSFAEAGIESATDLVHKRIGFWGDDSAFEVFAVTFHIGSDPTSGEHLLLVPQPFHVGPLLDGELDAAQALIYNGYGRLLGEVNPATGQLYREYELNVVDMNDIGTAMLQDHFFVRADWLAQEGNEETAKVLHRATARAWIYCRDNAEDCVRILLEIDPTLDESHQTWMMNEVNKLIWPSPAGIGVMDDELWAQTVTLSLQTGAISAKPAEGSFRSDLARKALASLLLEGLDVTGEDWEAVEIELRSGGE